MAHGFFFGEARDRVVVDAVLKLAQLIERAHAFRRLARYAREGTRSKFCPEALAGNMLNCSIRRPRPPVVAVPLHRCVVGKVVAQSVGDALAIALGFMKGFSIERRLIQRSHPGTFEGKG